MQQFIFNERLNTHQIAERKKIISMGTMQNHSLSFVIQKSFNNYYWFGISTEVVAKLKCYSKIGIKNLKLIPFP